MSIKREVHIFVDGNYLYHSARALGLKQDFAALERGVVRELAKQWSDVVPVVLSKHFYTRPPDANRGQPVTGWLRSHDWVTHTYHYDHSTQDTICTHLVHDLWSSYYDAPQNTPAAFVVVAGSGTLGYPLHEFPHTIELVCNEDTANRLLLESPNVKIHNLKKVLS